MAPDAKQRGKGTATLFRSVGVVGFVTGAKDAIFYLKYKETFNLNRSNRSTIMISSIDRGFVN